MPVSIRQAGDIHEPPIRFGGKSPRTKRCYHTLALKLKRTKVSGAHYELGRYQKLRTRSRGLELGSMIDPEGGGIASRDSYDMLTAGNDLLADARIDRSNAPR